MKKRHLIIGSSAASIAVLAKLRPLVPEDEITCITAQSEMPFNTCLLANYLSTGIMPATLYTRPESFFKKNNIALHLKSRVNWINPVTQTVEDEHQIKRHYDTLFLGIGLTPITVPTDFTPLSGYFRFHSLNDVIAIDTFLRTDHPKTAIVIGAGLSGIECADALAERGLIVTVVDPATHPLASMINKDAGTMLDLMMRRHNTTFYQEMKVSRVLVEPLSGKTAGILLTNNFELYADMVVSAIGAVSNTLLSRQVSPHLMHEGIPVNRMMQTVTPHIYAGGDAATVPTPNKNSLSPYSLQIVRSCTWPDAVQQGMIAAQNMGGCPVEYGGAVVTLSSHFFGTQVVSGGTMQSWDQNKITITHQGENWYHQFLISKQALLGFFMLGNIRNVGLYRKLIASQDPFDTTLLDPLKDIPYLPEK
jgi:NAD(P)H-nitrite reductase large subunit